MKNQTDIHTGFAGTARATCLGMSALGRGRTNVAVKHDANRSTLAVRWKP
jgi:hypothetical protein